MIRDRDGLFICTKYEPRHVVSTQTQAETKIKNPSRSSKNYYLSVSPCYNHWNYDWLDASGGLRSQWRTSFELHRALEKAHAIGAQRLIVPENAYPSELFLDLLQMASALHLDVCLQILATSVMELPFEDIQKLQDKGVQFDIVLDHYSEDLNKRMRSLSKQGVRWILPGLKTYPIWNQIQLLPEEWMEHTFLYFPYSGNKKNIFSPLEIEGLKKQLLSYHPRYIVQTLKGIDIYESRLFFNEDLEPLVKPVLSPIRSHTESSITPKISVIIPTYNSLSTLFKTLFYLDQQSARSFEVIVVDDGSTDETSEFILTHKNKYSFPMTYLYYPRGRPRTMGDSQFRAGRARNLGARWAQSSLLAFLDADIIVPNNYIESLLELHKQHDVVQWRRDNLTQSASENFQSHEAVNPMRDCLIPEGGYWHRFYSRAALTTWNQVEDYWKYTCTYALSLPKNLFLTAGPFRRTYCFYGCEDTELGLHLYEMKAKFYFNNNPVYHLYHKTERSEFSNSALERQHILNKSAHIFYYNTLSSDVFKVFRYLLAPQGSTKSFFLFFNSECSHKKLLRKFFDFLPQELFLFC